MKTILLVLRHQDDHSKIAELSWSEGRARLLYALELIKPELEQLIEDGLSEWVGPVEDPSRRTTPSSDPLFLERLAHSFGRQFNFLVELRELSSSRPRDTLMWAHRENNMPVRAAS